MRTNPLPRYVGYSEVCDAFGFSRSTIERQVRSGGFPQPIQLAPNRVGWDVRVVEAELERRSQGLRARAVADPDRLPPDKIEGAMRELGARHMSELVGKSVAPDDLEINFWKDQSTSETRIRLVSQLSKLCSHFEAGRARLVAAALFEELRKEFAEIEDAELYGDIGLLRHLASAALDDEAWSDAVRRAAALTSES